MKEKRTAFYKGLLLVLCVAAIVGIAPALRHRAGLVAPHMFDAPGWLGLVGACDASQPFGAGFDRAVLSFAVDGDQAEFRTVPE